MTTVVIIVTALVGFVIGYVVAFLSQKRKVDQVEDSLGSAREEVNFIKREAERRVKDVQARLSMREKEMDALQTQAAGFAQFRKKKEEEVKQMVAKVRQLETAFSSSGQENQTFRKSWQDAEQRTRQAETVAEQAQQRVELLERQLSLIEDERQRLSQRILAQEQQLQQAKKAAMATAREESQSATLLAAKGNLKEVLNALIQSEDQEVAVLSDDAGMVVDAVGEKSYHDAVAASPQIVGMATRQLEGEIPFTTLATFSVEDEEDRVICGKAFKVANNSMGLGLITYGKKRPSYRSLETAIVNVSKILE